MIFILHVSIVSTTWSFESLLLHPLLPTRWSLSVFSKSLLSGSPSLLLVNLKHRCLCKLQFELAEAVHSGPLLSLTIVRERLLSSHRANSAGGACPGMGGISCMGLHHCCWHVGKRQSHRDVLSHLTITVGSHHGVLLQADKALPCVAEAEAMKTPGPRIVRLFAFWI